MEMLLANAGRSTSLSDACGIEVKDTPTIREHDDAKKHKAR